MFKVIEEALPESGHVVDVVDGQGDRLGPDITIDSQDSARLQVAELFALRVTDLDPGREPGHVRPELERVRRRADGPVGGHDEGAAAADLDIPSFVDTQGVLGQETGRLQDQKRETREGDDPGEGTEPEPDRSPFNVCSISRRVASHGYFLSAIMNEDRFRIVCRGEEFHPVLIPAGTTRPNGSCWCESNRGDGLQLTLWRSRGAETTVKVSGPWRSGWKPRHLA